MDEAYTEIDATFRATKMHELPVPGRSHRAHGLAPGKWRVELRDIHVTPFEFKRTERAAWVHLSNATDSNVRWRALLPVAWSGFLTSVGVVHAGERAEE